MISFTRTRSDSTDGGAVETDRRLLRQYVHLSHHIDDEQVLIMTDDERLVRWRVSPSTMERWTLGQWTPVYRIGEPANVSDLSIIDGLGRSWSLQRHVVRQESSITVERTLQSSGIQARESITFHQDGRLEEETEVTIRNRQLVERRVPVPALGSAGH